MASLRDRQIASIQQILNLNEATPTDDSHDANATTTPMLSESNGPVFKVLVYDDMGRDVISSVLRVNDLRQWGVTIHLNINTTRHLIPDVPAIYLISPTKENLAIVTSDLSRGLYSPVYLNFLSSIPRPLLEDFAGQIATANTAEHLASLHDQYLNWISAEPDLFSLNLNGAYGTLNSAQTSDDTLDALVDQIVSGLFSVVATMGTIPIIRCARSGAAELVATKLDRKLRDHVLNSKGGSDLFGRDQKNQATTSRPVLIIADRNLDLIPMLQHSWVYQSLITDLLHMHLNKITVNVPIDEDNPSKGNKKQAYDLHSSDIFWQENATRPFPDVAEEIDTQLKKYEEDATEVTKKTGASSIDDLQGSTVAANLKGALAALPELKERKAMLTQHMNILKALIKGIEERKVHEFFQLEEEISKQTKANVLEIIKSSEKGNDPSDKLRFFIQWYLATEQEVSRTDLESLTKALEEAGADVTAINYIRTVRQLTRMTMIASGPTQPSQQQTSMFHGLTSLSSRVTDRLKDAGLGTNVEGLLSGIQNLIPKNKDLTLTKITESLMDPQNASSSAISKTENWLYFDPRSANARGVMPQASQRNQQSTVGRGIEASFGQRRQGFSEAIVFTVGGGSMDEYGNLQEWVKRTSGGGAAGTGPKRRVVYGSTALLSATEFITKDLALLGKEST